MKHLVLLMNVQYITIIEANALSDNENSKGHRKKKDNTVFEITALATCFLACIIVFIYFGRNAERKSSNLNSDSLGTVDPLIPEDHYFNLADESTGEQKSK